MTKILDPPLEMWPSPFWLVPLTDAGNFPGSARRQRSTWHLWPIKSVLIVTQTPVSGGIQNFGWGGSAVLNPRGTLSPNFAQNRGFSPKIAWKLHDLKKSWGARRARAPRPLDPPLSLNRDLRSVLAHTWIGACVVLPLWSLQQKNLYVVCFKHFVKFSKPFGANRLSKFLFLRGKNVWSMTSPI